MEKTINKKEAIHTITFDEKMKPRIPPARKPGRPKIQTGRKRNRGILGHNQAKLELLTYEKI